MNLTFHNFAEPKICMLNLNKNRTWTSFLYIKNLIYNLKRNLKFETFLYHRTFLYKVHELLLIPPHTHTHTHTHTCTHSWPPSPFLVKLSHPAITAIFEKFYPPFMKGVGDSGCAQFHTFLSLCPTYRTQTYIN